MIGHVVFRNWSLDHMASISQYPRKAKDPTHCFGKASGPMYGSRYRRYRSPFSVPNLAADKADLFNDLKENETDGPRLSPNDHSLARYYAGRAKATERLQGSSCLFRAGREQAFAAKAR